MKTQKIDIFESVWQRLPGVHPTIESDSLVCIPPWSQAPRCASYHSQALRSQGSAVHITLRSQNAHSGVKIKILVSHWLLLKGQSGQILLRVNTSIIEEKLFDLLSLTLLTPRCDAHWGVKIFELCDGISHWNWNPIQKFIRGPDGFESWKNMEVKNLETHSL